MEIDNDRIKHRQIAFDPVHPNPRQAHTAAEFLAEAPGIIEVPPPTPLLLKVSYDLVYTKLEEIEKALTDLGLHLDAPLGYRLKRALWYYTEDTYRANSCCEHNQLDSTRKVFVTRYENLDHSLRDHRPEHWRRYL